MTGDEYANATNKMNVIAVRELLFFSRRTRCLSNEFGEEEILKIPLFGTFRTGIARLCKPQKEPKPKLGDMIADRIFLKENTVIGSVDTYRREILQAILTPPPAVYKHHASLVHDSSEG